MQVQVETEERIIKIDEYNQILERYRAGEFGYEHLTLYEILQICNRAELFDEISDSDLEYLISISTGFERQMFCELKRKRQ